MRIHNLKRLRTLVVVREVTQRRLAAAAGYRSHAYVGRILRGEADTLDPEAAARIARFLEVGLEDLFAPAAHSTTARREHRQQAPRLHAVQDPVGRRVSRPHTRLSEKEPR